MASRPHKDQIAAALVNVLRTVTKGAGYRTDLGKNVSRRRRAAQELNTSKYPAADLWVSNTDTAPEQCMGSYRERVQYVIDLWVRADRAENVDALSLDAEADVKAAVFAAGALGLSFVHRVMPGKVQSDEQAFVDQLVGWKAVGVLVDYNWTAAAP